MRGRRTVTGNSNVLLEMSTASRYRPKIIASMTTHGRRAEFAHMALISVFEQTSAPDMVILNVCRDSFCEATLPVEIIALKERGLRVNFVEDIGPHTKLIPTMTLFPRDMIATFDDDMIYSTDVLEKLVAAHYQEPDVIHCFRAHRMTFDDNGVIRPYLEWEYESQAFDADFDIFPTGVGGVLYFPDSLHRKAFDVSVISSICPTADDVWFKAMSLLNGVKCKRLPVSVEELASNSKFVNGSQFEKLRLTNVEGGGNDAQILAVFEKYKLYSRFPNCLAS